MSEAPSLEEIVLVTGATGFIGSHLTADLAADGVEVHALVRAGAAPTAPGVVAHAVRDAVDEAAAVIDAVRPGVVVHLATLFAAQHQPAQIRSMIEANVTLGTVVAEGCARVGARLVHATSAWQHVGGASYAPVSLYAATKQAFVDIVEYYSAVAGLHATELCLYDTYGPADPRRKLVWLLLEHARSGEPLALSSGRQLIDLTHVDDVVRALRTAMVGDQAPGRLVVRSGRPLSVRDLAGLVEKVAGRAVAATWGARPDRPREMYEDWLIPGDRYGWQPQIALERGLEQLWMEEFVR